MSTQNLSRWKLTTIPSQSAQFLQSRTGKLLTVGAAVIGVLAFASTGAYAYDFFNFGGSTLVSDAEALLKDAATIATGIGLAAVAFFIGVSALRWLRGAA